VSPVSRSVYGETRGSDRCRSTSGRPRGTGEHAALVITTLTETDGRTLLEVLVEHRDKEGRDAHINSGMEDGMQESPDLLERIAVSLAESGKS